MTNQMLAVILGGGAGSRLFPLTATRSKPAVPIAGKYRLVDIPISNCLNSNVSRMFVLTQFNSASLNRHIKNTYQFSSFSKAFVDILAAEQTPDNPTWFQGTADAVRQSLRHINAFDSDYVLILSGDQLYQMDFNAMLDNHKAKGADISIATIPVVEREAPEFGILKQADGLITSFIEKPATNVLPDWTSDTGPHMQAAGKNHLASMGIYIFNRKLLFELLNETKKDATDFGKEIIPESIDKYKVASYQYNGYWTDIGNIYSFFEANIALTQDVPEFNLFDNNNAIYTRARMLPPSKIDGTMLSKVLVSEGCIIHASKVEGSVLGIRSRIAEETTIINTYVMGNDFYETAAALKAHISNGTPMVGIGKRCFIKNAIIDKDCCIGNDVRIVGSETLPVGDHGFYSVKDGIVVVKKGAIVPDGTVIQ